MKLNRIHILTSIIACCLVMLFSACSEDKATTYRLDLCVAVLSESDECTLLLDDGTTIYPENELSQEIENGSRYRVHYYTTGNDENKENVFYANILDIYPISTFNLIPRVSGGATAQERIPIEVKRIWIGGNYLNATFSFMASDADIVHTIELVRNSFVENTLILDLMHYDNGDAHDYSVTTTASFPLSSIWEYNKAKTIAIRVIESEGGNAAMNTYSIVGGKTAE